MEPGHEEAKAQESSRRGSWQVGWFDPQRGQAGGQPQKWSQGRAGQKPQEENRSPAQRSASATRSPEEIIQVVIATIRARFGYGSYWVGRSWHPLCGRRIVWSAKGKSLIVGGDGDGYAGPS
jgi:hypothetical protein